MGTMRIERVRSDVCAGLRERKSEIEQATIARVYAISDPKETADPEYVEGLWTAVTSAIEFGLSALERADDRAPIPTALLSQARLAARNRVSLETVLRRYLAGYTLLGGFVVDEAARVSRANGPSLKQLLRVQAALFDRVVAAVSEEYAREAAKPGSSEERRAARVRRLLDGEPASTAELGYELDGWHVGVLAAGAEEAAPLRGIARRLDCRLLAVAAGEGTFWAWFGAAKRIDPDRVAATLREFRPTPLALSLGEPATGVAGWRLTHRQAKVALPIALRHPGTGIRYGNVALLASMLQDDLLLASLQALYLEPLEAERDRGEVARETLRAYFSSGRHVSSAAAALGVSRQTVGSRLRTIEERLGRTLESCAVELELALRAQAELSPFVRSPRLGAPALSE